MSQDSRYVSAEYIYRSIGLHARETPDVCPPYSYLNLFNALERSENLLSSRYGVVIINRDPAGTPSPQNYFFTSPVVALSKLIFQGAAYRYAALADGSLRRLTGNVQGNYVQIAPPGTLSGSPSTNVVMNCFQTSQPYNFIYDSQASLKDNGTFATPELTGIDPSPYTLNAQPYSPLLTLIDNFASTNSYTTSGFSSAWSYETITTIPAGVGQQVVDFSEFINASSTVTGPFTSGADLDTVGTFTAPPLVVSGFTPASISPGQTVTLVVNVGGSLSLTGTFAGSGTVTFQYSANSGATWTTFYTYYATTTETFVDAAPVITISGATNLDQIEVRIISSITLTSGSAATSSATNGTVFSMQASVVTPGVFGDIANGMISILGTESTANVAISSVVSSGFNGSLYTTLTITTVVAHGMTGSPHVSVYGSSNDLVDGFYLATVTGASSLTVPYLSASALSATGGFLHGGAAGPATCVLANEYSTPYPVQFSAWGFYQQVPLTTTSFPVSAWSGTVAASGTATVGVTANFDLSINNQVTDDDLIAITLQVSSPANVSNIRLQFDVNGSGYTSSYYYKDIAPAYYQGNVANTVSAYESTQSQILADTLGLLTGAPPASTTAQLQPGNFSTGESAWVTVYIPRGNFVNVGSAGQSGLDWVNVTGWQVIVTTLSTGSSTVAINGIYLQWGYGPSSFAGIGYDYRYTYYDLATGTESSPNPEQSFGGQQFGYLSSQSAPFYLRQAVQLTAQYSFDPQVTHLRMYRRGGTLGSNWFQFDQVPNITGGGSFVYKDVTPDAVLAEALPLALDNDPPVTSSLVNPISTTLALATTGPGNTYYSTFSPQRITVAQSTAEFVTNQIVDVGYATNLEQVMVIGSGTGQFTAILRLQHNAGEPVNVYAVPRTKCNLSAIAYNRVWLAGDTSNPHYLYFSKEGYIESFSPAAYIPCGSPEYPITIVVNWRGTLFVSTTKTWYVIIGGAQPYAQPTGSIHGAVASHGWTETESAILYQALDGIRAFQGADGAYLSLPIEWIYRQQAFGPVPLVDPTELSTVVMGFYNNTAYLSYVSLSNSGQRYRINFDLNYRRFRNDDLGMTATYWEKDTNLFLIGIPVPGFPAFYCVAADQTYTQDYDDAGWEGGSLIKAAINVTIQSPFRDLGKPHFPKQWNVMELDVNTQGQPMTTELLFLTEPEQTITLATTTTTSRQKVQLQIEAGEGFAAYSASVQHTIAVTTTAPLLYQENIYAALLADYRTSFDTYQIKMGTDMSKVVKQGYFDYTSTTPITVQLYADDGAGGGVGSSLVPYFTFTLPAQPNRESVRVLFSPKKCRIWRLIATSTAPFQWWGNPVILWKPTGFGSTYSQLELQGLQ
jgi:hypothetical protein